MYVPTYVHEENVEMIRLESTRIQMMHKYVLWNQPIMIVRDVLLIINLGYFANYQIIKLSKGFARDNAVTGFKTFLWWLKHLTMVFTILFSDNMVS